MSTTHGWTEVSPGIWWPGTWRRRSTAFLRSWWTCLGWLASLSVSSLYWTAPTCWPHPASSYVSPVHSITCVRSGYNNITTHTMFWRMEAICDDNVIIQTNSSDFGRRVIADTQPDAPLRHKFLMARNPGRHQTHPDKRRPEANPGKPSPPWKRGLTLTCTLTMRLLWSMWTLETGSENGTFNLYLSRGRVFLYHFLCVENNRRKVVCFATCGFFIFLSMFTHLECGSLISETVEDAAAAVQDAVHASVCVVQTGVKL